MNDYLTLINLIKCLGIGILLSLAILAVAIAHAPEYPNDDGETM